MSLVPKFIISYYPFVLVYVLRGTWYHMVTFSPNPVVCENILANSWYK